MTGSALGIAVTASVAGAPWSIGSEATDPCPGIESATFQKAADGDLAALATIVERLGEESGCVALLRDHLAHAIGAGFIVSGVIAGLAVFAALSWRPAQPPSSSGSETDD
jgi:hypothetical protein